MGMLTVGDAFEFISSKSWMRTHACVCICVYGHVVVQVYVTAVAVATSADARSSVCNDILKKFVRTR